MNVQARLAHALSAARVRAGLAAGLPALPLVAAATLLAGRIGGAAWASVAVAVGLAAAFACAAWRARRLDERWLSRQLDARRGDLDDSAELLFADERTLASLQRLQRERLRQRIAAVPMPDLRPKWPWRRIAIATVIAAAAVLATLMWPRGDAMRDGMRPVIADAAIAPGIPRLTAYRLRIAPPAYTGLAAYDADGLDASAPEGSRLQWTLRYAPQPGAAELAFHDGERVELARDEETWVASHTLERSILYRIVAQGAPERPPPPLHRLDAIADRPPAVRVLAPEQSLTLMTPGQRTWPLSFEASDDYGVAADAHLHVTLAQGSGENITFSERTLPVRGSGEATRRRFDIALDPIALGLGRGEDLVARLEVRDNRAARPQSARSASLILRWPAEPMVDTAGLDVLAREVLPAYFRSQRQIIIDAQALLKEKPTLDEERFLARSDTIGVDQRLLRLRYGQFLGEEAEGAARPPPTHDADAAPAAPALPIDDYGQSPPSSAHDHDHDRADADPARAGDQAHGHDHDEEQDAATFGSIAGVLEEFGHLHDLPEAATLLDPRTRETLRAALREMWESELALRQGDPARALPYAHRALDYIQQIRQADRIYLARVGSQLPPIDESRRLGGDRAGIARRALPPSARPQGDAAAADAWHALADAPGAARADLEALEGWLRDNRARIEDPLALVAAIDALRNSPDCEACRRDLRARLWTVLERPQPRVQRRDPLDDAGGRYLDALRQEAGR